jgi:enoyl-CoA hydratase/carnithine racemase
VIGADEALRIGLVDEVVPHDQLMDRVRQVAAVIAEKSPAALQFIKDAVKASVRMSLDEGVRFETTLFGLAFSTQDKEEGVGAFLEKRKAEFQGK